MVQASTAQKTTTAKKESNDSSDNLNVGKVTETVKDTALASLGIYGKLFDNVKARVESVRKASPKKWDDFVQRGEQVKDAADEKVNKISFSYKFDMAEQRAQFGDIVKALRVFVTPSKA